MGIKTKLDGPHRMNGGSLCNDRDPFCCCQVDSDFRILGIPANCPQSLASPQSSSSQDVCQTNQRPLFMPKNRYQGEAAGNWFLRRGERLMLLGEREFINAFVMTISCGHECVISDDLSFETMLDQATQMARKKRTFHLENVWFEQERFGEILL